MQIGAGLQFNDNEPTRAVDGKQVENPSVARGERRHLAIHGVGEERCVEALDLCAHLRFQPSLWTLPVERMIVVGARTLELGGEALDFSYSMGKRCLSFREAEAEFASRDLGEF